MRVKAKTVTDPGSEAQSLSFVRFSYHCILEAEKGSENQGERPWEWTYNSEKGPFQTRAKGGRGLASRFGIQPNSASKTYCPGRLWDKISGLHRTSRGPKQHPTTRSSTRLLHVSSREHPGTRSTRRDQKSNCPPNTVKKCPKPRCTLQRHQDQNRSQTSKQDTQQQTLIRRIGISRTY